MAPAGCAVKTIELPEGNRVALEVPQLLVADVRSFFQVLRDARPTAARS